MSIPATAGLADFVGTWKLNTERTSVSFRTSVALVIRAKGTLQATEGAVHVGPDGRVSGEIVVDPASVDTKTKRRDDHLRSADYFEVANHPTIAFVVTDVRPADSGGFEVHGDLTVRGRSTPLTSVADVRLEGDAASLSTEVVITKGMLATKGIAPARSWVTIHAQFDRVLA